MNGAIKAKLLEKTTLTESMITIKAVKDLLLNIADVYSKAITESDKTEKELKNMGIVFLNSNLSAFKSSRDKYNRIAEEQEKKIDSIQAQIDSVDRYLKILGYKK